MPKDITDDSCQISKILADVSHRPLIHLSSLDCKVDRRYKHHHAPDQDIPIERLRREIVRRLRPERKDEDDDQKQHAEDIERQAKAAEIEFASQQRLAAQPLERDTADGDDVRGQQGARSQGAKDVECNGGAEIDAGDDDGDDEADGHGIQGHINARANLGYEAREREALIAGKGPELAGSCCEIAHEADDSDEDGEEGHDSCAGVGLGDVVEDLGPD